MAFAPTAQNDKIAINQTNSRKYLKGDAPAPLALFQAWNSARDGGRPLGTQILLKTCSLL